MYLFILFYQETRIYFRMTNSSMDGRGRVNKKRLHWRFHEKNTGLPIKDDAVKDDLKRYQGLTKSSTLDIVF